MTADAVHLAVLIPALELRASNCAMPGTFHLPCHIEAEPQLESILQKGRTSRSVFFCEQ